MITASPRLLLIIRLARPLEPIVPTSKPIGLRQWIWRAFVRSALIPLVLVETALIAIYLLTNNAIRDAQIEHLRETALNDLEESRHGIRRYADRLSLDPQRLAELDRRMAEVHRVSRKHRLTPAELAECHAGWQDRLQQLAAEDDIEALEARLDGGDVGR